MFCLLRDAISLPLVVLIYISGINTFFLCEGYYLKTPEFNIGDLSHISRTPLGARSPWGVVRHGRDVEEGDFKPLPNTSRP